MAQIDALNADAAATTDQNRQLIDHLAAYRLASEFRLSEGDNASARARQHTPPEDTPSPNIAATTPPPNGVPVYDPSECIGPIIMGECKGSILPHSAHHQTCYGTMLNGQCTGPMF